MRSFYGVCCVILAVLGCSDNQNDIGFGSNTNKGGSPSDSSSGAAGTGGTGNTSTGGVSTGGVSTGGVSTGGVSTGGTGGASGGNGGSAGNACMTPSDCPQTAAPCSEARCIGGSCVIVNVCTGDSGTDAAAGAGGLCGNEACAPTRCNRIDCGPAVCCQGDAGPTCLHGVSECPASFARKSHQCWSRIDGGSAALLASCRTAADCFVAKHYTGCCRVEAIGLHVSEFSRFEAFETSCGGPPVCGCCCDRVFAEDGGSGSADAATIAVDCVAGVCRTRVP